MLSRCAAWRAGCSMVGMLRLGSLAFVALFGGCYSHARGHAHCATPIGVDLAYMAVSAADVIISAIRADHADYEAEDESNDGTEEDEINAATSALAAAPPALDRAMIANALPDAKQSLARCARPVAQQVKVSIAVRPSGTVDRVILRDHVDAPTSDCVIGALQVALFPMTQRGGSFTYPFTL